MVVPKGEHFINTGAGEGLVSSRLELLEDKESYSCFAHRQSEAGFQPLNPSENPLK